MNGLHLSHYAIEAELGRGGMGIVYRAKDTKLNRTVALKVLPAGALASEDDRARFLREAQASAQLNHPNVCHVYEVDEASLLTAEGKPVEGQTGPRLFIAMEYIDGAQLDEGLAERPLPVERAIAIARQMAEALKAAHERGIVHRDIKSANVMLTKDGTAKVLDFGLAKTEASTKLTQMGSTVGTIAYMSPEQARGEEVDHRTDLWSLGAVLYEMLTGRVPFPGSYEQAVVYGILNADPQPLTAVRTGVPMDLERIVNKLLSKAPRHRYQSAAGLLADLETVDVTAVSTSRSALAPAGGAVSRKATGPWIWVTTVLALAAGLLLGRYALVPEMPAPAVRHFPLDLGGIDYVYDVAVSRDGRYVALSAGSNPGDAVFVIYDFGIGEQRAIVQRRVFGEISFSPDGSFVLMDSQDRTAKFRVPDGELMPLPPVVETSRIVKSRRDGSFLFRHAVPGRSSRGVWQAGPDGRDMSSLLEPDSARGHRALMVDEILEDGVQALLTVDVAAIGVADLEAGTYEVILEGGSRPMRFKNHLLYRSEAGGNAVMAMPFDFRRMVAEGPSVPIPFLSSASAYGVSESGMLVYSLQGISSVQPVLLDPETGNQEMLPIASGVLGHPAVSPTGDRLVMRRAGDQSQSAEIEVFSFRRGVALSIASVPAGSTTDPAWSADGRYVYFSGSRAGESGIYRTRSDGSGSVDTLDVPHAFAREPALSPDARWLAYMGAPSSEHVWNLYLRDLRTGEDRTLASSDVFLHDPTFSPDSRYVAYEITHGNGPYGIGQDIRVASLEGDRTWRVTTEGPGFRNWDPMFSADGRFLYYRSPGTLYRQPIALEPEFTVTGPREIIDRTVRDPQYALMPDGRILALHAKANENDDELDLWVIQNWHVDLERMAPRGERRRSD